MMATEGEDDLAERKEQMQRELAELMSVARVDELAPADFLERLESIHVRYLGESAYSPELVDRRRRALAAYDEVTLGVDRHHELELLAEALGVHSD